ncbi:MAG: type IX secretion system protein PorQ [Chitinophagales bacterium]|nr:type IX secretion system protein PorQ [Chitinophagales bacterium]
MRLKTLIILLIIAHGLSAQIESKYAYSFLTLPPSARVTALGGLLPTVMDDDITLALSNPASLNDKMHNQLAFAHNFHFADIQNGYVAYGRKLEKPDIHAHIGVQYISYGDFDYADILGHQDGTTFKAGETALVIGASKNIAERISAGINVKGVFSHLEQFTSTGIVADLGINYFKDSSDFILSFVVKNLGTEITTYNGTRFGTPLDIQIGISKRLRHLPFRFSIIAHQLQHGNIRYDDPDLKVKTDLFGEDVKENSFKNTVDNVFRHLVFSGEFLLGKHENLRIRGGYNHLRRQELSLSTFRSLAGFSLGFGIKISYFKLDYGVGYHHVAGATNHITIRTDMGQFF